MSGDGSLRHIAWPPLEPGAPSPHWNGREFVVGAKTMPVLIYPQAETGWDDDLADLAKEEVGRDMPLVRASHKQALEELTQCLKENPGAIIMEIGCSNGFFLDELLIAFPNSEVIGTDYSIKPLERLAKRRLELPLIQMDLLRCNLPGQMADAIVARNVLEHITDDLKAMEQIFRLLKPGGVAVIEVPAMPQLYDVFDKLMGHKRRYIIKELIEKLESVGFFIERRNHMGFLIFPLVRLSKRRLQKLFNAPKEKQRQAVLQILRRGKRSRLLHAVLVIEAWLRRVFYLPCGVRCLITCRRPV